MVSVKYRIQTVRWIVACTTFFVASITLLYGPARLEYPAPIYLNHLAVVVDALILAATFYASIGLITGRQVAWRVAVFILCLAAIWDSIESRELVTILSLFPLISLSLLYLSRGYYQLPSGRVLPSHALRRALVFTIGSTLVGCLAFFILAVTEHRSFGLLYGLVEPLDRMYVLSDIFMPLRHATPAHVIGRILLFLLGVTNYTLIALALLQPVADHFRLTPTVQRDVMDLLMRYATSSEDYFKYFPYDKSYYFANRGDGFVAYSTYRGVCVAIADPIAASAHHRRTLLYEFIAFCEAKGWKVSFVGVTESSRKLYTSAGLSTLKVGENAMVAVATALPEALDKKARNVINRFTKSGFIAAFEDEIDRTVLAELRSVSDEWLSHNGRKEYQFAMGYFNDSYVQQSRIFTVRDASGRLIAFTNLQPNYAHNGVASIDMMRSDNHAPSNTMDFLLIRLLQELHQQHWQWLDLGLAPLAGLEKAQYLNEKSLHLLYRYANRWFAFHGLRRFKDKFHPTWQSSYLAHSGTNAQLPAIAQAINEVMKYKQS